MKVQIVLAGQVIDTQIISIETMSVRPSLKDVKRLALKASQPWRHPSKSST